MITLGWLGDDVEHLLRNPQRIAQSAPVVGKIAHTAALCLPFAIFTLV